ncbi:transferase [Aureococcus anophagefferens]|nr:transferase [Aureococcus anophagefferens]
MKLAPLVLALGSVRGDDGFQRWLDTHGANTRSTATLDVRRANFLSNQALVDEHNAAADAGEHSFWLTTDGPLADLSLDEYRATLLSFGGGGIAGGAAAPAASAAAPPPDAFDWRDVPHVVGKGGIEPEKDYNVGLWSKGACKYSASKAVGHSSGYQNVTHGDETALQAAAYAQPVVSVGIDASSVFFQLYFRGVYDHKGCKNGASDIDHGVAVVGYGSEGSKDYWIVRNSWGALWGDKGYVKMARNKDNQCGIATMACYAVL